MIHQEQWRQLVAMIARHTPEDGRHFSPIDFLSFGTAPDLQVCRTLLPGLVLHWWRKGKRHCAWVRT